jgi:hypothetical protein
MKQKFRHIFPRVYYFFCIIINSITHIPILLWTFIGVQIKGFPSWISPSVLTIVAFCITDIGRHCITVSQGDALHEELFDGYVNIKHSVTCQVCNAKASLPQHSFYSVFSTLQGGVWL